MDGSLPEESGVASRETSDPGRRDLCELISVLGGTHALGRGVGSMDDLVALVRHGLPFQALTGLMEEYGIPRESACHLLQLSHRKLLRRREQGRLSPRESDRLVRLARVLAHANRVFEDTAESAEWIRTPNTALGRQQPLSLLDTDIGVQQVDQVLGRIEQGIVG
jgi:putative toxin-antitoxin system antitoxin component (TIGR02293 family)